jgi:alpha-D-ribose 1-methylphosphonate 5-triphosphate synthase subunit PhnH
MSSTISEATGSNKGAQTLLSSNRPRTIVGQDATDSFRVIMRSLARPGTIEQLPVHVAHDPHLKEIVLALPALVLANVDSKLAVIGSVAEKLVSDVAIATDGSVAVASSADLVLGDNMVTPKQLRGLRTGTALDPENGARLCLLVDSIEEIIEVNGPGGPRQVGATENDHTIGASNADPQFDGVAAFDVDAALETAEPDTTLRDDELLAAATVTTFADLDTVISDVDASARAGATKCSENGADHESDYAVSIELFGPGIRRSSLRRVSGLSAITVETIADINKNYPAGIDVHLVTPQGQIMSIPRSSRVRVLPMIALDVNDEHTNDEHTNDEHMFHAGNEQGVN